MEPNELNILASCTIWKFQQWMVFGPKKKCSHKYEKWTDVTIGASNAYWQKTSVLNFLNFRILRTLPHTTESHLKAIGLADWLLCLWLNVLTQAGAGCCLALRKPSKPSSSLTAIQPTTLSKFLAICARYAFKKSQKAADLNIMMAIKWIEWMKRTFKKNRSRY